MVVERLGDPSLMAQIESAIAGFSGEVGLYAKNLTAGTEIGYRSTAVMPTASVIKICVLAELYRQAEVGTINLSARQPITAEDWSGGSGILKEFEPGLAPTIADLARMMIVVSDNVATGILVRLLARDQINATMRAWGLHNTDLVWRLTPGGDIRDYAVSTPRDMAHLLELIARDAIVTPAACAAMRDHLRHQQYVDQIPRYLPYNPYAIDLGMEQAVVVANKTGFYPGVRADAAIIQSAGITLVLVTMTEGSQDLTFSPEHEGNILNGRLARLVFDAWVAKGFEEISKLRGSAV